VAAKKSVVEDCTKQINISLKESTHSRLVVFTKSQGFRNQSEAVDHLLNRGLNSNGQASQVPTPPPAQNDLAQRLWLLSTRLDSYEGVESPSEALRLATEALERRMGELDKKLDTSEADRLKAEMARSEAKVAKLTLQLQRLLGIDEELSVVNVRGVTEETEEVTS